MKCAQARPLLLLLCLFLTGPLAAKPETKPAQKVECGVFTNGQNQQLNVEVWKNDEQRVVSLLVSDAKSGQQVWYNISPQAWKHLADSYEQAWKSEKAGMVGGIEAMELRSNRKQPLEVIRVPGKGVLLMGMGKGGKMGIGITTDERALVSAIMKKSMTQLK